MKPKISFKRIISLFVVFILFSSVNLAIFTSATTQGENSNEGYFNDDFYDYTYIDNEKTEDCTLETSLDRFILAQSQEPIPFDYDHKPDSVDLWYTERFFTSGINQLRGPDIGLETDIQDKNKIGNLDLKDNANTYFSSWGSKIQATDMVSSPIHRFRFKISRDLKEIESLTLKWWFGKYDAGANLDSISIYFWNYGSTFKNWDFQSSISYQESRFEDTNPDISIFFNPDEYVNNNGIIDLIIVGNPTGNDIPKLNTDYINLSLTTEYGYVQNGVVTSKPISPTNLLEWDKVIWDGTKSSSTFNITVEVLNKNGETIDGFKSKSSPMDISSLKNSEISIRATLQTNSISKTPRLDSWSVIYKRKSGFNDEFTGSLHTEETLGLKNVGEKIQIDSFFGDWPLYGKTPDNNRYSYEEPLTSKPSGYYWFSDLERYGGGFRAPVVSDGKIYISSAEKMIHCFDEIADPSEAFQQSHDSSDSSYVVDTSLALSDDNVIFGTNANSNNFVCALNKSNLKQEIWKYVPSKSKVAFTSAPTLYDGNVIISSCSGDIFDTPFFSVFSSILKTQSKLYVLDEANGEELYDPIELPAASHSTPAVANDKIFAACQNINGNNLFAFDLYSGEQLWNVSTGSPYGLIGKSSPVYADGKVFVTCNQRDTLFSSGKNMLMAFDSSNGAVLWNKTLATPKISFTNLLNGIFTSAPITSPVYHDDNLFVLSSNGTFYSLNPNTGNEKWSYTLANNSIMPGTYCTTPTVVGNKVYVIKTDKIFCFDIEQTQLVKPDWFFKLEKPGEYYLLSPATIYASPIYADGMLIISATHNLSGLSGGIYCVGNYQKNLEGSIKSNTIEIPKGYWWRTFDADIKSTENNTILFDILDQDEKNIEGFSDINGSSNNISSLNKKKIKLFADFNIGKQKEAYPHLNSWSVSWLKENKAPIFSVTKKEAWVNEDLSEYSVSVEDQADGWVESGLDISSGKYKLTYIPNGETSATTSDWIDTFSDYRSGVKKATITAKISESDIDIKELVKISFKISDLAGNVANTSWITFNFDGDAPVSEIVNKDDINNNKYTDQFALNVEASDVGDSGIKDVILKYRYSNSPEGPWGEWINYTKEESIFNWYFGSEGSIDSGYYNLISIACDNALNYEPISDDKGVIFLFDENKPSFVSVLGSYTSSELPTLPLDISDDFKLDSLYYKMDFKNQTDWTLIKEDINEDTDTVQWTVPDDIWVDLEKGKEYIVYFKITDLAGNEFETDESLAAVIIKNLNASHSYLDLSEFSEFQTDDKFEIKTKNLDKIDVNSIKLFYKYSNDDKTWDENWTQFDETLTEGPFKWEFNSPNGNGYYKFYTLIEDISGKTYVSESGKVNVSQFPIIESIIFFVLLAIAIIISSLITIMIKKKKEGL